MGYSMVKVDEIEPAGPGGAVRFVRRELGVEAFGVNWFELPPNAEGRRHDESETGQEEVNVIVQGSGVYRIDGDVVPFGAGSIFRFDPETTRPSRSPDPTDSRWSRSAHGAAATRQEARSDGTRPFTLRS
jgi:hypothetical protein